MKPERFNYLRPATLTEALDYLQDHGMEANLLAGGQSLVPLLNMRLSMPDYLIDLSGIKELSYIRSEGDKIIIGAMTRQIEVERSPVIEKECPLLQEAVRFVGNFQIRNRGTIGGSIAHADPSSELPCVLSALRGSIVIVGSAGERVVAPEEFFLSYLLTSIGPDEIVKEVHFPVLTPTSGYAFVEKSRRYGDFALAGATSILDLDENGCIISAHLAVSGVSPVPCILEEIEAFLIGKKPSDQVITEAAEKVHQYIEPEDDLHASAEYRGHLASILTKRALKIATARAAKEGEKHD